jgi:hypothetical protein
MGRLLPSDPEGSAQFAQIYVLDNADDQLNRRMEIIPTLNKTIMQRLTEEILQHNAFARAFQAASVRLATMEATADLVMRIKGHNGGLDSRRYNAPVAMEIAAWIPDGAEPVKGCRDIMLFAKSGEVKHISELHPAYMPLHFPLLFPYGESGWHPEIPRRGGDSFAASDADVNHVMDSHPTSLALFESLDDGVLMGIPVDQRGRRDPAEFSDDGEDAEDPEVDRMEPVVDDQRCSLLRFAAYHIRVRDSGNFTIFHSNRYDLRPLRRLCDVVPLLVLYDCFDA